MEKINVYDFDGTIYNGNSSVDFFAFCMLRKIKIFLYAPRSLFGLIRYRLNLLDDEKIEEIKDSFFEFLIYIDDLDKYVDLFWNKNMKKIKTWYLLQKKDNDLVITSSPTFLIEPICLRLGIKNVIGTNVDLKAHKTIGKICTSEEKIRRFKEIYGDIPYDFYSDDIKADSYMIDNSDNAYLVKKAKILKITKKH